ncbi:MAG TPA: hypothetical protein VFB56_10990, partial [Nitrospiraceae bacterium]|nr:hypothetical protein [Nitrospiraceae bacterium]
FDPFSFLVVCISGSMNQDQQQLIEYLIEENRVLRERRPCTSWAGIEAAPRRQSTIFSPGTVR